MWYTEGFNKTFVCTHAGSGLGCGFIEAIVMSVLFWIAGCISIFFLVSAIRASKVVCSLRDQTVLFWLWISIWQFYHGTITFFPFHWDQVSYVRYFDAANHILMFIPMCLVILLLFELLFNYRNPGTNGIAFFRWLFVLFLVTFVALGAVLSFVSHNPLVTADHTLALWCACTDLILALFFTLPAISLLDAVTYPMVQPEDACCVNFCKVGIVLYVCLFSGRMIYNGTLFFGVNRMYDWLIQQLTDDYMPTPTRRAIAFTYVFFFDFVIAVLGMISVFLFKKHGMMFNENPYYTRNE
jgi:hypothetical protein